MTACGRRAPLADAVEVRARLAYVSVPIDDDVPPSAIPPQTTPRHLHRCDASARGFTDSFTYSVLVSKSLAPPPLHGLTTTTTV